MRDPCLLRCELKSTGSASKKRKFSSKRVESRAAEHFVRDLPQAIQGTPSCAHSARKRTRPHAEPFSQKARPRKGEPPSAEGPTLCVDSAPAKGHAPMCGPTQRTRPHAEPPPCAASALAKRPSCTTFALRQRVHLPRVRRIPSKKPQVPLWNLRLYQAHELAGTCLTAGLQRPCRAPRSRRGGTVGWRRGREGSQGQ